MKEIKSVNNLTGGGGEPGAEPESCFRASSRRKLLTDERATGETALSTASASGGV